jgi:hypothetical protein
VLARETVKHYLLLSGVEIRSIRALDAWLYLWSPEAETHGKLGNPTVGLECLAETQGAPLLCLSKRCQGPPTVEQCPAQHPESRSRPKARQARSRSVRPPVGELAIHSIQQAYNNTEASAYT